METLGKEKSMVRITSDYRTSCGTVSNVIHKNYIFNGLENIFHSQRYHSRSMVTPHHGESLPRRSLPISKYGSCGPNRE